MKSFFFICLLLVHHRLTISVIRQYFYNSRKMNWISAQKYCRHQYTDLATITTQEENQRVLELSTSLFAWIGLNRTKPYAETWQWSDGEESNYTNWYHMEPNDFNGKESCVIMYKNQWADSDCDSYMSSVCYKSVWLVHENKTWEKAFQHCRAHNSYLVIVDTRRLQNLLKTATKHAQTISVWTSLRFLDGTWLWVNGVPLESQVSLSQCPKHPYRCGAYNFETDIWENKDCNEKLYFLCYG